MASKSKQLRSGYTTGACAAAAAKAATITLIKTQNPSLPSPLCRLPSPFSVSIPFPDGSRHTFTIARAWYDRGQAAGYASVIKDAGDDPDVTDGAEIVVSAAYRELPETRGQACNAESASIVIKGGTGVGVVTRPGLSVPVGQPAINPVPARMIREAAAEAVKEARAHPFEVVVTVSVPQGESLSRKTLNSRLGIIGGISILGTTGIVRPVSSEAWTATITASMNVAHAMGREEIVLSSGRSSERAHMAMYGFPEETYVMMGDYVEYALLETKKHPFRRAHLCAQWAKMLKIAMATPQTHARHGAIDANRAATFLRSLTHGRFPDRTFNTAREIFDFIDSTGTGQQVFPGVCAAARTYAASIAGPVPVVVHLVSYHGEIIAHDE